MSIFYTSPPVVVDGDVAFAKDVNDINSETNSGFNAVESALGGLEISVQLWAELAEKWAEEAEDTEVEPGAYSAFHWATKGSASASSASSSASAASSSASTASSAASSASTSEASADADATQTALDVIQTGSDATDTAADRVQTGLDVVATNADVVTTNADAATTTQDAIDTAADAASTAQDAIDTAADLVATNQDTIDTAADRVQTGLDVTASGISETNAATSAAEAAASAASIDPDLLVHQDALDGAAILPPGTTAERPSSPVNGMLRYNEDLSVLEDYTDGAWADVYDQNNILGTVSETSGVPTGAIIERGSNANGEYIRFADGTMICTKDTLACGPPNIAAGSIFLSNDAVWTFPSTFISPASFSVLGTGSSSRWLGGLGATSTVATMKMFLYVSSGSATDIQGLMAIGRWF